MTKKIEQPKLKKIGGLKNFTLSLFIKVITITLVSVLVGGLAGKVVQNSFSDLTGYNKKEVIIEQQPIEEDITTQEASNIFTKGIVTVLDTASAGLEAVTESGVVQKANEISVGVLTTAFKPLIDVVSALLLAFYTAIFWVTFVIMFIITAWLTNKLIFTRRNLLTEGVNPQVIKNMEILEAKVGELVDNANEINNK